MNEITVGRAWAIAPGGPLRLTNSATGQANQSFQVAQGGPVSTIVERGPVWQISQRFGLIERSTEDAERLAEHRRVNARAERERAGLLAAATVGTDNKVYLCRKARARRAAEVLGLHHEGLSSRKIEAKTGVPRRTVRRILKAEGRRHD